VGRKLSASRFKDQPFRKIVTVYSENKAKHMNTLCGQSVQLLGMFAQLLNPTNSSCLSVSPFTSNTAIPSGWIFAQFNISGFFLYIYTEIYQLTPILVTI
jgi:hypothetical protein